jgi:hypothetical protein
MGRGISRQQAKIIEQLFRFPDQGFASMDFEHIFFNEADRQGPTTSERRKACRAQAKRAIVSLKERGIVSVFYRRSPSEDEYQIPAMYPELTDQGKELAVRLTLV